ncbi:MAG: hypothetical protein HDQ92_03715 [Desulfovibrio sp.]|nr:hypothetical protein [Desulfovibrio sp.]
MQVSGSYSAIGALTGIDPTQPTRREPRRSGARAGDTVSISEEAMAAFRNSLPVGPEYRDEAAPDAGAKFRQALVDAWNENEGAETSLMGQLRGLWSKFVA